MKGLVVELKDGVAAVLCEDGTVTTTTQPCSLGETIELETKVISFDEAKKKRKRWLKPLVAAALAVVILGGSYRATTAYAASYVSLDVEESSVELSVNPFGRVISVSALNEESQDLAEELTVNVRNLRVDDALDRTVRLFDERGFLNDEDDLLLAGITSDSARFGEETSRALERFAQRDDGSENYRLLTVDVPRDQRQEARSNDLSGGRFAFEQRREEFEEEGFFFPRPGEGPRPPLPTEDADWAEPGGWGEDAPPPPEGRPGPGGEPGSGMGPGPRPEDLEDEEPDESEPDETDEDD